MNQLPEEVLKMILDKAHEIFWADDEEKIQIFQRGATWALQSQEVMAIINRGKDKEIAELKASIAGYKAFLKPLEDAYNEETEPI